MKLHTSLLTASMLILPTLADSPVDPALSSSAKSDFASLPVLSRERLSGSLTAGLESSYTGRGIPATSVITEGNGVELVALKLNYDFGVKSKWSWDSTIAYRMVSSGHTMYGNPMFAPATLEAARLYGQVSQLPVPGDTNLPALGGATKDQVLGALAANGMNANTYQAVTANGGHIKEANIENEFVVQNAAKYTTEYWNMSLGHTFIHGGMLGIMAKHYRDQSASCVNEVFFHPEYTPFKWLSIGCDARFSFQGITGWWFIPDVTFKAPIIGTPEDVKLAGVVQFAMSATADYYQGEYFACDNGTQAFWIKLSTPWFVRKNFIVTPSVSFNWLGKGAEWANRQSEYRKHSGNDRNVPFKHFDVVYGLMATYTF